MTMTEPNDTNDDCSSCASLLKEVLLLSKDSKPHVILDALSNGQSKWKESEGGVEAQIPAQTSVQRRWSRLTEHQLPLVATSSKATTTTNTNTNTNTNTCIEQEQEQEYEWLQVSCRTCTDQGPEGSARAFVMGPSPLSVVVCSNRLRARGRDNQLEEMREILTHELIHVYDVRKLLLDLRDCQNLAYSEVRAAREAECQSWFYGMRSCIRSKALTATNNMFPKEGQACLKRVFDAALADKRPLSDTNTAPPTRQQQQAASDR
jgi:hypothetical protein